MTAPNNFPGQNGEAINQALIIPSTPEVPPRPESLVYADGAIYVSRDPSDVEGRLNQDGLLRLEDKNVYGVFGGVEGNDGAACTASKAVEDYFGGRPAPKSTRDAYNLMGGAMFEAREALYAEGPERTTTGTIVQAYEDEASGKSFVTIGHAGDSRAYILRAKDGKLEQLTDDQGFFTPDDDVYRGGSGTDSEYQLTNVLGGVNPRGRNRPGRRDQIINVPVAKGDRIMLCTNGVTGSNALTGEEVATAVTTGTPREAAISLATLSIGKDANRKADDKSAFVLEIGKPNELKLSLFAPEASTMPRGATSVTHLGRLVSSTGATIHLNGNLFEPERRVVKGFPDSREGLAGHGSNNLKEILNRIRRPGETSQVIDALIEAAETEQSEIGYVANGTSARDKLVDGAASLVALNEMQSRGDPSKFNSTIYDLGVILRSFKPLNQDLVSPTEWEKATSFYRDKGPQAVAIQQINMANKFMHQVEALGSDPSLMSDRTVQKMVQNLTILLAEFRGALVGNAPWDGVKANVGHGADLASNRMLAIMNGQEAALLQGNKHKPTITTDQMGLIERLAKEYNNVTNPGGKRSPNPDYIHAKGINPARIMLAYELLDLDGINQVLGAEMNPDTMRIGRYKDQHDIRWARRRREFREGVYQNETLPRVKLLGMSRDTLIALLKDDHGTQIFMNLMSNAASGPLRNKLLVQAPPTP